MVFDDIVVGSGLTALAAVIGLDPHRRVLVLAGPREGRVEYYDSNQDVPRAFLGFGGLGRYWHGVIPTAARAPYARQLHGEISRLFRYFYPEADIASRLGKPWLFVPRQPIRPAREWMRLAEARGSNLDIRFEDAAVFEPGDDTVSVRTASGSHQGRRLWIGAGALRTPKLIEASLGRAVHRGRVSDHLICYCGQIDRTIHRYAPAPRIERVSGGFWMEAHLTESAHALLTTKPARFDYRTLDRGFEQRRAFGLRTGSALSKIASAGSPGLVAEALFNKFGLFPDARMLSVYAQVLVRDAYRVDRSDGLLRLDQEKAARAIDGIVVPWPEMTPTAKPDRFLQGIHLHHTIDTKAIHDTGIGLEGSIVRIMDPSILSDIGPEHHSFHAMANAYKMVEAST